MKRLEYLDIAKGIGILLVYVGHCYLNPDGWSFRWIYSFHMPLFFFISGILFSFHSDGSLTQYVIKKMISLLLPYTLFSIVYLAIYGFVMHYDVSVYILRGWGMVPLWFIPVLFLIEVLFALMTGRYKLGKALSLLLVLCLFVYKVRTNGWLPYCVSEIPWFMLCFVSGAIYRIAPPISVYNKSVIKSQYYLFEKYSLIIGITLFISSFLILYYLIIPYNPNYRQSDNDFISYIFRYIIGILGTYSTLMASYGIQHYKIAALWTWLGKNSLVILCVHWLPLHFFHDKLPDPLVHLFSWIFIICTVLLYNKYILPQIVKFKKQIV